jgi:hypothetical protein
VLRDVAERIGGLLWRNDDDQDDQDDDGAAGVPALH